MDGACWLFSLPAFTGLGHECQDLWSPCNGMHVCTDCTLVFTLYQKEFWGNGVRTHVNSKGKLPPFTDGFEQGWTREHLPSTTIHQRTQICAVFSSSFQEWPLLSISASVPLNLVFMSLPLFLLRIPSQSLSGDVAGRLPEGVANPTGLSSMDLSGHWFLICCLPQVLVSYLLWPLDTEDSAQTPIDESPELVECCSVMIFVWAEEINSLHSVCMSLCVSLYWSWCVMFVQNELKGLMTHINDMFRTTIFTLVMRLLHHCPRSVHKALCWWCAECLSIFCHVHNIWGFPTKMVHLKHDT